MKKRRKEDVARERAARRTAECGGDPELLRITQALRATFQGANPDHMIHCDLERFERVEEE